jgi:hypothetical protein
MNDKSMGRIKLKILSLKVIFSEIPQLTVKVAGKSLMGFPFCSRIWVYLNLSSQVQIK